MKKRDKFIYVVEQKSTQTNGLLEFFSPKGLQSSVECLNEMIKVNRVAVSFALLSFIFALFLLKGF